MTPNLILERAVERATGEKIDDLRRTPIDDRRRMIERRTRRPFRFTTAFPFIGRGNVLRDRILSHEEVETALRNALRHGEETL